MRSVRARRLRVSIIRDGIVTLAHTRRFRLLTEPAKSLKMLECHKAKRSELGVNSANVTMPFNVQRHLTSASTHRGFRATAMDAWRAAAA